MIFQLIYTCALSKETRCKELSEIARLSRDRNLANGITGILICKDGSALQVLEGTQTAVEALYKKISEDPRVVNTLVLLKRTRETREFPEWSMGFRFPKDGGAAFKLSPSSYSDALPQNLSRELDTISQTFARVNGLVA